LFLRKYGYLFINEFHIHVYIHNQGLLDNKLSDRLLLS
jgi:hypothetical protein